MKSVTIDRTKRLKEEPDTGHNRWHPDIPHILTVDQGEEVVLETRDCLDLQFNVRTTEQNFESIEAGAIHPLTGPIFINEAEPGDLLEIEFLDIIPEPWAFSSIIPGFGFLRDIFDKPFMVHWDISDHYWATSGQIPGVRIPGAPFMGVSGVAPSHRQIQEWTERENRLISAGGMALSPDADGAVPHNGPASANGLRTLPPRENGGNFDVKQLTKGSKLFLPVAVEGALFSTGDAHFAQGDGEVCVTAIEMSATVSLRFRVLKGEAKRHNIRWPRFQRETYFVDPHWAVPKNYIATMGMPITDQGVNDGENLTLACRNALINMINLLQERGFSREQAYVICSVAVDLKISNVVDVPNYVVSAFLPEGIFQK